MGLLSEPERMLKVYGTDLHPGFFYSLARGQADARLLGSQVLGTLFIIGWTTVTMAPFFLALNAFGWLRCESVEELVGLDVCYNGENGTMTGESKNGSDGEELMREEYMEAYEEYKQNLVKKTAPNKRRNSPTMDESFKPFNDYSDAASV